MKRAFLPRRRRTLAAAIAAFAVLGAAGGITGVIVTHAVFYITVPKNFPTNTQDPNLPVGVVTSASACPSPSLPLQTPVPPNNPVDDTPGPGDTAAHANSYWTQQRMQAAVPNDQLLTGSCVEVGNAPVPMPPVSVPGSTPLALP